MCLLTKFYLSPISGLYEHARKVLDQSETRKRRRFSGAWAKINESGGAPNDFAYQKIIMIGEAHNELVHQIGAKSDQRFLCKCVGSAQSIRGQKKGRSLLERDQK